MNISGTAVDVGGQTVLSPGPQLFAHGGRPGDELQMLDGIRVGNLQSNAGRTGFALSPLLWDQVDVVLSGQGGDSPTLGVQTNALPKSGGNTMAGIVLIDGAIPSLQSSNLTSRLSATSPDLSEIKPWGLTGTSSIKSLWDLNASLGGPVAVDKIWFYGTGRGTTSESYLAGHYFPVDPRARVRVIDPSRQVSDDQYLWDTTLRLTSAVTPKMRWTNFGIYQHKIFRYFGFNPSTSPEAAPRQDWPRYFVQTGWTYTATNRLLFEAGWNYQRGDTSARIRDDQVTGTRYVETGGTFDGVVVPPMTYGAPGGFNDQPRMRIQAGKASMSYVTGTHNAKFGSDVQLGSRTQRNTNYSDYIQYPDDELHRQPGDDRRAHPRIHVQPGLQPVVLRAGSVDHGQDDADRRRAPGAAEGVAQRLHHAVAVEVPGGGAGHLPRRRRGELEGLQPARRFLV